MIRIDKDQNPKKEAEQIAAADRLQLLIFTPITTFFARRQGSTFCKENILPAMTEIERYTFPKEDTEEGYLNGFWGWVALLENGDYKRAAMSLNHNSNTVFDAESLRNRVQHFFGEETPLTVVIPNDRLVGVINESAHFAFPSGEKTGWMMAQIPLTNEPNRAKDDDIMLMGAAISLFVVPVGDRYGFDFEIFHA